MSMGNVGWIWSRVGGGVGGLLLMIYLDECLSLIDVLKLSEPKKILLHYSTLLYPKDVRGSKVSLSST